MKKLLAWILTAVLLLGAFSVTALATDGEEEPWGVWYLTDITTGDADDDEAEMMRGVLQSMAASGNGPRLTIEEDGSAVMDLFGETTELQFDFDEMTVSSEGETIPFTLEDGVLTMSSPDGDGTAMLFTRGSGNPKAVGVFDYYFMESLVDDTGKDYADELKALADMDLTPTLTLFRSGYGIMDIAGTVTELEFDFDEMTITMDGESAEFTVEDGLLTVIEGDGKMTFRLADPGCVGSYQLVDLAADGLDDVADQLELLIKMGMAPTLTVEEDGSAEMDLFGTSYSFQLDFDKMTVTLDSDLGGESVPFEYENGRITISYEDNLMVFQRAMTSEEAEAAEAVEEAAEETVGAKSAKK